MLSKHQCWRCDVVESENITCTRCRMANYCSKKCLSDDKVRHQVDCDAAAIRNQCKGCGKETSDTKQCSNCLQAWFCGPECQKRNWSIHKAQCKEVSRRTVELVKQIKARFVILKDAKGSRAVYYFGNTPASDLINLQMNEGERYSSDLNVLLCGVGDPRSVCLSIASLPDNYEGRVTFVLNDICACGLARTVLLLYMMCKGGVSRAEAITQIWYSLYLNQEHFEFLVASLHDLTRISNLEVITHGVMQIDDVMFKELKSVWNKWLTMMNRCLGLAQQRNEIVVHATAIKDPVIQHTISYLNEIPENHKKSATDWFDTGILLPSETKSRKDLQKENVTLTGSNHLLERNKGDYRYAVPPDLIPFAGWDYKSVRRAFPGLHSLQEMYNNYVTQVVRRCAERMQGDTIKMNVLLCDCREIPRHLSEGIKFDRIMTSNLLDYVTLPTLLDLAKPLLNPNNSSAVILTESKTWLDHYFQVEHIFDFFMKGLGGDLDWYRKKDLQDTKNPTTVYSEGETGFVEYCDLTEMFTRFIRASLLAADDTPTNTANLPSLKRLASDHGLLLRDFTRHENAVIPFRWAINCRRVNFLFGYDRCVEWTLVPSS